MYEGLGRIEPEACFSYPFELLCGYNLRDAIAVFIGISMVLVLFCQEAESGTVYLIKPPGTGAWACSPANISRFCCCRRPYTPPCAFATSP